MNYAMAWDFRVTLDLFLGGLGVGAFLTAILGSYLNSRYYSNLIKKGFIVAPVAVSLGVIFLLTELGRPERFLTTMFHFNPGSAMSWGAFLQVFFMVVALLMAWQAIKGQQASSVLKVIGTILALGVGLYHGALLTSSGSNPLWNDGLVPVIFFVSSILAGCSFVLLLNSFGVAARQIARVEAAAGAEKNESFDFRVLLVVLLVFQLVATGLWMISLGRTGLYASGALQLFFAAHGALWWAGAVGLGLVLPLVLAVVALKQNTKEIPGGLMSIISLSILVGGFIMKQVILTVGQIKFPIF
ncbi:MAG: polysulfide reductase NrfD [Clostridia bacterium]|nr:polysulfide reductase NrfD [Clostridia bacterium]